MLPPHLERHSDIARKMAKAWKCTERTIHNYIRQVCERWKLHDDGERDARMTQVEAALIDVYQSAKSAGQHSAAVYALDRLARLRGLYPDIALRVAVAGRVQHQHAHLHAHTTDPKIVKAVAAAQLRSLTEGDLDALEALDRKAIAAASTSTVTTAPDEAEVSADATDAGGEGAAPHGGEVSA